MRSSLAIQLLLTPALALNLPLPPSLQSSLSSFLAAASAHPQVANLRSQIESIRTQLPEFEVPGFIRQFTDPIGASPLLSLHRDLVQIPSVTYSEGVVGDFLVEYLTKANYSLETQVVGKQKDGKDRFNVLAYLGKNRTTRALVTSHIDTVPPFIEYKVAGGKIWGRGSNDAKGSVAAMITAASELIQAKEIGEGDVALLFVVGEELSGDGMRAANDLGLSWEAVVFGEPTEMKLASGHKGLTAFTLNTKGKAGHSGYPELGRSAIHMLVPALAALEDLKLPSSKKLGNSTLNIGKIEGGVAHNVIAAEASAEVLVRIAEGSAEEMRELLTETIRKTPYGEDIEIVWDAEGYGPQAMEGDVPGFEKMVVSYGTDIPNLKGDHRRYLYGPGSILVAHSAQEFVSIQDLQDAVNGYKRLIREALHPTAGKSVEMRGDDEASGEGEEAGVTVETKIVETVVVDGETQVADL